jgi:2-succinyl-5-enolpyruvyl-6-hydroxy-3-cyclohexene-1-carboxylate synthase
MDVRCREAIGRRVDRIVCPGSGDAPLAVSAQQAKDAGLTDEDIDSELAADNAERRG